MDNSDLEGVWFSTGDLKLAISLHAAGFPFRRGSECTRIQQSGRETFFWHFSGTNDAGEAIADFISAWEKPAPEGMSRPSNMTVFFLAREIMFNRTHVISESHKVPSHHLLQRGDQRLAVTSSLGRSERDQLARLAS